MKNDPNSGALPTRQRRSEQTRDRLLEAGYQLIHEKSLNDMTISDVATRAGCSVGAFYRRFKNKEVFEEALLSAALQQARELMLNVFETQQNHEMLATEIVRQTIARHVRFAPIYKAAILRAYIDPGRNTAAKQHGRFLLEGFLSWTRRTLGRDLKDWETTRITMSFQILFGTIINALLGRPGPFLLDDPEFGDELTITFVRNISTVFETESVAQT